MHFVLVPKTFIKRNLSSLALPDDFLLFEIKCFSFFVQSVIAFVSHSHS